MTKSSVIIDGVGKKFSLQLRSALKYGLIDSFRRMTGRGKDSTLRAGEFWALQDVNVSLEPGDALGIMGVNGSGKTTLLRILNGTYSPDAGKVTLRGRIGALIAAGAGFSPMLSGRENVFINGALLGMTPQEIRAKFDEIVSFADLDKFIDMPVRNYSSGMNVRLGFAIAVLGQPDILLVDEVLAVGDIAFQKKCYERILTLRRCGVTILLVAHSIGAIWTVCNKGMMIEKGKQHYLGTVEEACRLYEEYNFRSLSESNDPDIQNQNNTSGGTGEIICEDIRITNEIGETITELEFGQPAIFCFSFIVKSNLQNVIFRCSLDSQHHKFFMSFDSFEQGYRFDNISPGHYVLKMITDGLNLRPGAYSLNHSVVTKESGVHLFFALGVLKFSVLHPRNMFLISGNNSVCHKTVAMELSEVHV